MTAAHRMGNKLADSAVRGLRIGEKASGEVSKYGKKALAVARHVVGAVEATPFLGQAAAPVTGLVRSAIATGDRVVAGADLAKTAFGGAATGLRSAQIHANAGDASQAAQITRQTARDTHKQGRALNKSARSLLERPKRP